MQATQLNIKPPRIYVRPAGPGEITEADLLGAVRAGDSIQYRGIVSGELSLIRADVAIDVLNALREQEDTFNAELVRAYAHGPGAVYKLIARLMKKELADTVDFCKRQEGEIVPRAQVPA